MLCCTFEALSAFMPQARWNRRFKGRHLCAVSSPHFIPDFSGRDRCPFCSLEYETAKERNQECPIVTKKLEEKKIDWRGMMFRIP
jgi:hypothetical protein